MSGLAKLHRSVYPSICIKVPIMSIYTNFWDRRFSKRRKLICTAEGILFVWRNNSTVCPLHSLKQFQEQNQIFFITPLFHTLYQTVWFKQVAFLRLLQFSYLYFVSAISKGFLCRTASPNLPYVIIHILDCIPRPHTGVYRGQVLVLPLPWWGHLQGNA